jgi:hypothetical protein
MWGKDVLSQSELIGSSEIDCAATEDAKRSTIDANLILKIVFGVMPGVDLLERLRSESSFKGVSWGIYMTWKGTSLSMGKWK